MLGAMSNAWESDAAVRWRELVRGHAASGLSVAAYCRQMQVPQSSFYAWRRKLRDAGALRSTGRSGATFAAVCVTPEPNGLHDHGALELHLPHGRRVIVRPGFDRQTLRDLIAVLERGAPDAADREADVSDSARHRLDAARRGEQGAGG